MSTKIIQIEQLEVQTLLDRFTGIENQLKEIRETIKPNADPDNEYLTRKDIATKFNIAIMTVHYWSRKGILKAYKVGHRVYYKKNEIDQALVKMRSIKG